MRETEIVVEQQPPQAVLVCDHAGLVINKFSLQVDGDGGGGSVECVTAEEELTLQDYYLQGLLSQGKRLKIPDNVSLLLLLYYS